MGGLVPQRMPIVFIEMHFFLVCCIVMRVNESFANAHHVPRSTALHGYQG